MLLPPANEVWGNVICLQGCVCPQGGGYLVPGGMPGPGWGESGPGWGEPGPRGCLVPGVPGPGGVPGPRGGAWSQGGCLVPGGLVLRGVPGPGEAWSRGRVPALSV